MRLPCVGQVNINGILDRNTYLSGKSFYVFKLTEKQIAYGRGHRLKFNFSVTISFSQSRSLTNIGV